jgi:phosphotransferase system  glucose/maltose/N-acetylglucosamine-specific IIC component
MSNRTAAIIITIVAVLLCGCPGLAALCWGAASLVDYAAGFGFFASDQATYLWYIIGGLCGGILLIAIAIVVGFFVLRKKKEIPPSFNEPIPPAI